MKINDYQRKAERTINRNLDCKDNLLNGILGLNGEVGELTDSYKKHLYQDHPLSSKEIISELGDVCWYVSLIATSLGHDLEDIMKYNIKKLEKRYPNGFDSQKSINRKEK